MTKKIITIVQAFSKQGLGVTHVLLESKQFKVRVLTSRVGTDEANHLQKKYGDDVEVIIVRGTNKDDLTKAFTGSYGVFFVSPTISHEDPNYLKLEYDNVTSIAKIATECNIKHLIFSGLDKPCEEAIKELGDTLIWAPRTQAQDFIKQLPIHSSFISIGYFYSNFIEYYVPTVDKDGVVVFSLPDTPGDVKLPYTDCLVTPGLAVRDLFLEYINTPAQSHNGKHLQIVSEYLTGDQVAKTFEDVTGKKSIYKKVSAQDHLQLMKSYGIEKTGKIILTIFQYPIKYGYFDITNKDYQVYTPTSKTSTETFKQFLQHTHWKGESTKEFKDTLLKSYDYL